MKNEVEACLFSSKLDDDLKLSIVGGVGHWSSQKVACVCRDFRATVKKARELRLYEVPGLSISAGNTHTVISIMGRVYTCGGSNDPYQPKEHGSKSNRSHLGHGDSVNELVPRLVTTLVGVNVVGTSAGHVHTVVWTDKGKAYSFGHKGHGRLGHGSEENEYVSKLIEGVLVGKRVVGVAAGSAHTVVWTDEGKAYSFGPGAHGKLGHDSVENEHVPRLIEGVLVGKRVVGVSAGYLHTVVWTDEGKAYSFGFAYAGQLGHGCGRSQCVPRLGHGGPHECVPRMIEGVLEGKRVVGVATGMYHTVVWMDEGKAYSFGCGQDGKLGHGGEQDEHVPRLIEGVLVGKRVVGVAAGSDHTVAWTDDGKAYSFGDGEYGKLGHGSEQDEFVPRLIEGLLMGKRVVGVSSGSNHTVVWTDEGNAYSFGFGQDGKLGHGGTDCELVPRLLECVLVGKRVVEL